LVRDFRSCWSLPNLRLFELLILVTFLTGGFVLQLLQVYSKLRCIVQDRPEVIKQAKEEIWPQEAPAALKDGRVAFMEHDFFQPNPVKGADVYWLRGVLYEFPSQFWAWQFVD
jgi:O-methyltransferase domain